MKDPPTCNTSERATNTVKGLEADNTDDLSQGVTNLARSMTLNNHHTALSTVIFNVGGKKFEISRKLLSQNPNTMLSRSAEARSQIDPNAEIFIENNGERFQFCLDYLRSGRVSIPYTVSKEDLLNDLDFYGIENIDEAAIVHDARGDRLRRLHVELIEHWRRSHIERIEKELERVNEEKQDNRLRDGILFGTLSVICFALQDVSCGISLSLIKCSFF
mmetsp:Transcript_42298/g.49437  ORF Transcript_42298/g.49437 Transcript_42298/m.49437 type:complete len:218 (+) Transcript_42298:204-857(+)